MIPLVKVARVSLSSFIIIIVQLRAQTQSGVFYVFCRIEDLPPPTKKLTPELTPLVLFTGFEPMQVQQYIKVTFMIIS